MSKTQEPKKTLSFNPDKATNLLTELIKVFQKYKPTVGEILVVLSNLIYALGSSIGGYKDKGPGLDELNKLYYSEPGRIDVGLMLQGMMFNDWYQDWEKIQTQDNEDKGEDTNEPNAV